MTSAERFWGLLAAFLSCVSILGGGMFLVLRVLWTIRGAWDRTNTELRLLVREVQAITGRYDRLEQRVERHEAWHADRPGRAR